MTYTVFAEILDMAPVDRLQEGAVMQKLSIYGCR